MTTEIAVINSGAVALAADSAVTIAGQFGPPRKSLTTSNKLFTLSKYEPIGVMVYNSADIFSIPWESLIKMYRKNLGEKSFPTVRGYCDDFFMFLEKCYKKTNPKTSITHATSVINAIIDMVNNASYTPLQNLISGTDEVTAEKLNEIHIAAISKICHQINLHKSLFDPTTFKPWETSAIQKQVDKSINGMFPNLKSFPEVVSRFQQCILDALSTNWPVYSGIVFAGFGSEQITPHLTEVVISEAVVSGGLVRGIKLENGGDPRIIPFAQSDDITTFMEGISPTLGSRIINEHQEIFNNQIPITLADTILKKYNIEGCSRDDLIGQMRHMMEGASGALYKKINDMRRFLYIDPIVNSINFLSKTELASMAETLVNLVSFRKQVTLDMETVGGPIDVAVITKGDGFIWIKRKHYFKPELNHHFFTNYYRETSNG